MTAIMRCLNVQKSKGGNKVRKWILVDKDVDFEEYLVDDSVFGKSYYFGIDGYGEQYFKEYHEVKRDNSEDFPEKGPWLYSEERYKNGLTHILGVFYDNCYVEDLEEARKCKIPYAEKSAAWEELINNLLSSEKFKVFCICAPWREGGLRVDY